jgi:hypothetical protein
MDTSRRKGGNHSLDGDGMKQSEAMVTVSMSTAMNELDSKDFWQ